MAGRDWVWRGGWQQSARSGLSPSDPDSGHPGEKICSTPSCNMDLITCYGYASCFFCPVIFFLRVAPASKQSLAEHVIRHSDVMRQNCRPKTKLDALLCAQISASNKTVFFLKSNLKFLRGTPWRNILKNWLFLATAIIFEVIATSALKSSEGFTRLVPSFIVVAGYAAAFYFLSLTLKSIPVGIAYAVWSGLGIVLVTAIAWVLHGQKLDMWGFVGVGFIISGVAVLNLLSKASVH